MFFTIYDKYTHKMICFDFLWTVKKLFTNLPVKKIENMKKYR